jgi:predicted SAM-dependent methyltransferase
VDQVHFPHVDHVQDIRSLSNFPAGSASLIYACQVIEYFDREEVLEVLRDWKRVLAPGGILRLSVPNFAVMARLYQAGLPLEWFLGTLYGKIPDGKASITVRRTMSRRCARS